MSVNETVCQCSLFMLLSLGGGMCCACLHHVRAWLAAAPEAGMWSAGLYTPSARRLLSSTGISTDQLVAPGGLKGLWVGEQVFWQAPGSLPCTLGCLLDSLPCHLKDSSVKCLSLSLSVSDS